MKSVTEKLLVLALLAFAGVVLHASRGSLFAQTSTCNETGTGERCGTIKTCTSWQLANGEINTTGIGVGAVCKTEVEIYLFKVPYCPMCHYPIGGGGSGSGGGGGGGGTTKPKPCGDPDLWSDDTAGCDQDTQQEF